MALREEESTCTEEIFLLQSTQRFLMHVKGCLCDEKGEMCCGVEKKTWLAKASSIHSPSSANCLKMDHKQHCIITIISCYDSLSCI